MTATKTPLAEAAANSGHERLAKAAPRHNVASREAG